MNTYSCREIINTENLDRIIKAKRLDPGQLTQLQRLRKRLKEQKGISHEVIFTLPTSHVGRLYPKPGASSVQGLKRDVRKALTHDSYTDIDIVNCHPVLLSQLFKRHNLECPCLDEYITHREEHLESAIRIIDDTVDELFDSYEKHRIIKNHHGRLTPSLKRDLAKTVFLRVMYGGTPSSLGFETSEDKEHYIDWIPTDFLLQFHKEFKHNSTTLLSIDAYKSFMQLGEAKSKNNPLGTALSLLAQDEERKVISAVIKTFKQNGYKTGTVIHDGFLVESLEVEDEVLRNAEQAVKFGEQYDIKLTKKLMHEFDEDLLWGVTNDDIEVELESDSDTDLAIHFIEYMEEKGHAFTRSEGEVFWFNPEHGIYLTGLRQLRQYINNCPRLPKDRRGKTDIQNKWTKQIESLVNDDPEFRNKVVHTTYRKIAFKNGYYDCDKKALCAYNRDVYFLMKGGIDYVPQEQGVLDEVWNKLFLGVFGEDEEVSTFMKHSFSRAMAGEFKDKRLFFIVGEPNSGKGTITEAFRLVFASQFNTLDAKDFCAKKSDGNSALSNQHLVQGRNKRVAFLNETSRAKGQEWNAQAIKVFSNGGESISGRLNYAREAKCFINQQTGFCNMNDTPKINGFQSDVKIRCVAVRTAFSYISPKEYDPARGKPFEKVADEDIKDVFLRRPEVLQAFAQLICEGYIPERPALPKSVRIETDECFDEEDEETKIKGLFEDVTDFKGDEIYRPFISKKQFVTKLEENHIFISTHRLTKHMVRWGYSKEDRNRRGDRGWLNIQFVNSMLDGSGDF